MTQAIVFDCEFAAIEGSQRRFWCGPFDPDPFIVQIGAAKLSLTDDYPILETLRIFIQPVDRSGAAFRIDPFLTQLTGITETDIADKGVPLETALAELDRFSNAADFWSWGKDELNMIAISCFAAGLEAAIPASRFGNACRLLLRAGMSYEDIQKTRSGGLAACFCVDHPRLRNHDALDDAMSVACTLQHLLRQGRLTPEAFSTSLPAIS